MNSLPPTDWWDDLLPARPHARPPGAEEMLRVIVYDVACPRRLKRIAEICLDHGVRVQKSVFECWLDDDRFDHFWEQLQQAMHHQEDQILAYTLDAHASRHRRNAGDRAIVSEKRSYYIL